MAAEKRLSLLVLAAGMGSRYGGIKQIDGFGPSGETIMDYSLFDALRAGFNKVVFIVRDEIRETVEEMWKGLLRKTRADYGIAVSGIAGPAGGTCAAGSRARSACAGAPGERRLSRRARLRTGTHRLHDELRPLPRRGGAGA